MTIDFTAERHARYRKAVEALGFAITNNAPNTILDALQQTVVRYAPPTSPLRQVLYPLPSERRNWI